MLTGFVLSLRVSFGCLPYLLDCRQRHFSFALCPSLLILLSRRSCTSTAHPLYPSTVSALAIAKAIAKEARTEDIVVVIVVVIVVIVVVVKVKVKVKVRN